MIYKLRLVLRMNYEKAASGSLILLTTDNSENPTLEVDVKCNVDENLDALVAFMDANITVPSSVSIITARGNYKYDIIRDIEDTTELNSAMSLFEELTQD